MPGRVETEEGIVQGYFAALAGGYRGAFGLLDDAAVLAPPPGHDIVVTVDAIAAGIHFFPDDAPADIGWKALAVNVSDLAAKGARPLAYVMSIAFPEPPAHEWLAGFSDGLAAAQTAFGMHLAGGDTDRRPGPLSIAITAFGLVPAGSMVLRGAARAGEAIFVSGSLGDAALGLRLRRGLPDAVDGVSLTGADRAHLIGRYLRPQPRLALGGALRMHAGAAMDISDGLLKDLGRMATASGVGARIEVARLPLSAAAAKCAGHVEGLAAIVAGGDDYEILAAVSQANAARFTAQAAAAHVAVTQIGEFFDGTGVALIGADGLPIVLARTGYDHF